jgi:hypothetical protein
MGGACLAAAVPPAYALENTQCLQLYGLDGRQRHPRCDPWIVGLSARLESTGRRVYRTDAWVICRDLAESLLTSQRSSLELSFECNMAWSFHKYTEPQYCEALEEHSATTVSTLERIYTYTHIGILHETRVGTLL